MDPIVSVIMSVYNEPVTQIKIAVDSLLTQTFKSLEIIVVLDSPQNRDVRNYLSCLSSCHDNVFLIENNSNIGLAASLNKAVSRAKGSFCARMDADDFSFEERIEKQISFLQSNPDVDLLFTQWQEIHSNGNLIIRTPRSEDVKNLRRNFFLKSLLLHPTLVIRTDLLKKFPYPEMDRPEDWVLFLDLINLGFKFDLLEEVLYSYFVNDELKFLKVRAYSQNLLPRLAKYVPIYYGNIYFWVYFWRIFCEFCISRNEFVYNKSSKFAARFWKKLFKSV